jgi:AcrR family transcriptional regulator
MDTSEPKWKRQPDERPQQILQAALEVFAEKGFRAATMDEIAARAGITKGTIYLYFPSKEELFVAMTRWHFQRVVDLLPELRLEEGDDPETVTRRVGREFLGVLMTPEVAKAVPLIIGEFNHIPALQRLYREEVLPNLNFQLATLLELGMDLGFFRRVDPVIAARSLMGMFFVFVMTQEVLGAKQVTPMTIDDIADTIVSVYFHGILKERTS